MGRKATAAFWARSMAGFRYAAARVAAEHLDRRAGSFAPTDLQPGAGGQPLEATAGEEAHVSFVEDPAAVVVERPCRHAQAWIPVAEVGHAGDDRPPLVDAQPGVGQQPVGMPDVLDDVGGEHDVVPSADARRYAWSRSDTTSPSSRSPAPSCSTASMPITSWPSPRICSPSRPSEHPRSKTRPGGRRCSQDSMRPWDVSGPVLSS